MTFRPCSLTVDKRSGKYMKNMGIKARNIPIRMNEKMVQKSAKFKRYFVMTIFMDKAKDERIISQNAFPKRKLADFFNT